PAGRFGEPRPRHRSHLRRPGGEAPARGPDGRRGLGHMRTRMHSHPTAYVTELAARVFGDQTKAQQWLNRPSVQLGGRTPLEMLAAADGAPPAPELPARADAGAPTRAPSATAAPAPRPHRQPPPAAH